MATQDLNIASAAALHEQLDLLERERASAALSGLAQNELYMGDLLDELDAVRAAFVGAAVSEIATLRAALGAPLLG